MLTMRLPLAVYFRVFYLWLENSCCIHAIGSLRALRFVDARMEVMEHMCPGCCLASASTTGSPHIKLLSGVFIKRRPF